MSNSTNKRTAGTRHISHHRTTSDAARLASCLTSMPRARGLVADGSVKPWRRSSRRLLLRRRPRVLLSQRKTCSPCASAAAAQTLPRPAELAHALLTSGFRNGLRTVPLTLLVVLKPRSGMCQSCSALTCTMLLDRERPRRASPFARSGPSRGGLAQFQIPGGGGRRALLCHCHCVRVCACQ